MVRLRSLTWALAVAVAAFGLGVVGFLRLDGGPRAWPDVIYHCLQLFVLGSDPLQDDRPHPVALEIARLLAPSTTVYALIETLGGLWREEWRRRRVAGMRQHAVVCGDDAASRVLAVNLRAAGSPVVRVAPGTGATEIDRDGVFVVHGDARELATLRAATVARAGTVYACAMGSGDNAAVALAVAQLRGSSPGPRLSIFAQVADEDLVEALRVRQVASAPSGRAWIDFFAVHDIAARELLTREPLVEARTVTVVGSGAFPAALARALIRTPVADTGRSVWVHTDTPAAVTELATRFDATTQGATVRVAALTDRVDGASDAVVVCLRDDESTVGTALRLLRSPGRPVIACLPRQAPFDEALSAIGRLTVFGVLDAACHPTPIQQDAMLGRAARTIHENYVENCRKAGDTPATNTSMRAWAQLPAYLQESNFAQAEHIGAKLRALGAALSTSPPATPFTFRDGEVLTLAKLEHQRWMHERRAAGFRWGPMREGNYHPGLVDWPNLPEDSRRKDIEAVEQLPPLLAQAGLYITRLPSG
jgi:hypothetical protein